MPNKGTYDAIYDELTPYYGGIPLWQSTQDMLDAFWLSQGFADIPEGDALFAFYKNAGAAGTAFGDLENDYWNRIGPSVLKDLGAVLVLDARNSKVGEQTAKNMGSGGSVLDARYGSTAGVDTNDPLFLNWTGDNYAHFPAVAGNNASIPHVAGTQIGDVMEYRLDAALDLSAVGPIAGKLSSTGSPSAFSWYIYKHSGGRLGFGVSDGVAETGLLTGDVTSVLTPNQRYRFKFRYERNTGAGQYLISFWYSTDLITDIANVASWTSLANITGSSIGATFDFAATVMEGSNRASSAGVGGSWYESWFSVNDSVVYRIDFTKNTSQSSFVCTTGQTVTINRAASGRKTVVVTRPVWLFGTDDYMEVADNAVLNFANNEDFTIVAVARQWSNTIGGYLVGKKLDGTTSAGWAFGHNTGNVLSTIADGTTQATISGSPAFTVGALHALGFQMSADTFQNFVSNTAGSTLSAGTVGSLSSSTPLRVAAIGIGVYDDVEVFAVAVFRRALTVAEIAQIVAAFGAA